MKCINCGSDLPDDARFCFNCGAKVGDGSLENRLPGQNEPKGEETGSSTGTGSTAKDKRNRSKDTSSEQKASGQADATPDTPSNSTFKSRLLSWWKKLTLFSKIAIISSVVVAILLTVSICAKRVWPIVFSVIQVIGLLLALLMHGGIVAQGKKWLKYLVLSAVILLSVANIASYSWGKNNKKTDNQPEEPPISQDEEKERMATTPYSAESATGQDYSDVESDFTLAGFTNITSEALKDLDMSAAGKEGHVESITINGVSDFEGNQEFSPTSRVLITYHSLKETGVPVSSEAAKTMDVNELISAFSEAGFSNVNTEEVTDLDPDEVDSDSKITVSINGSSSFEEGQEYPIDAEINIVTHKVYEKYTVRIIIDFVPNLIFSKYDVDFSFGGEDHTLAHGVDAEFEYRLRPGTYTLSFTNVDSYSVDGSVELAITGETEASYQISCYSDKIDVKTIYVEDHGTVGANEVMAPMSASDCAYKNYAEIVTTFRNAGFTNIRENILYDIVWGWTENGEVDSVTVNGSSDFARGNVFSKDAPVVITYHMPEEDNPSYIQMEYDHSHYVGMDHADVERLFKEMGFSNIILEKKETSDASHKDGEVYSVSIDYDSFSAGKRYNPEAKVRITYYVYKAAETPGNPSESPSESPSGSQHLSYTTNDLATAKKGNTGVYAYKKSGSNYSIYYIIDFDERYVYRFTDGGDGDTTCDRLRIESGDLNSVLIVTYHDGDTTWSNGLHFNWVNQSDHLIMEDNDHFEWDFYPTDLYAALSIKATKRIVDY